MAEADPSTKLRTVLDYVPCEACLSQPVAEQELLCSVCRRLDRQIGIRIAVTTTVLVERPSPPEPAPVVIPPPAPSPEPLVPGPLVEVVSADAPPRPRDAPAAIEVVVEPLVEAAPEPEWDEVASFEPAFDDMFGATPGGRREEPIPEEAPEIPQDDFVFRPPPPEEEPAAPREEAPAEEWMPTEEAPVEEETSPWAPQPEPEPRPEPEEAVEELEIVETEVLDEGEEWRSDLWRLRGFDQAAATALGAANVRDLSHLSGHDPAELSARTGLDAERLGPWIHVADLVQEVGVPVNAAVALVAAGVAGPRGLQETDAETIVERASVLGGAEVKLSDVKRWKRRA